MVISQHAYQSFRVTEYEKEVIIALRQYGLDFAIPIQVYFYLHKRELCYPESYKVLTPREYDMLTWYMDNIAKKESAKSTEAEHRDIGGKIIELHKRR